jgi:hypothetical protein
MGGALLATAEASKESRGVDHLINYLLIILGLALIGLLAVIFYLH